MRLQSITVQSFLGARDIDIRFDAPAVLVAAANGHGKSSLIEAVRLALTGDTDRLGLKKDVANLISDGAKSGLIGVTTDAGTFSFKLPSCERGCNAQIPHAEVLPLVLDPTRFAAMKPDERRSLLFKLTGLPLNLGVRRQQGHGDA